jgi:hypothetical protein
MTVRRKARVTIAAHSTNNPRDSVSLLLSSTIANAADLPSRKASPDFAPPAGRKSLRR